MPTLACSTMSRRNTWRMRKSAWASRSPSLEDDASTRPPLQVLSAVERDHLPRHGRQGEDGEHGPADLIRCGAMAERNGGALPGELLRRLPRAWQGGAGPDAVDPDARGQRERHLLRQRPEPGLGHRVGDEVGRDRPHALVE